MKRSTMVSSNDSSLVKALLTETIAMICKNSLSFRTELNIEALIGITIDRNDVFLVSIREAVSAPESKNSTGQHDDGDGQTAPQSTVGSPAGQAVEGPHQPGNVSENTKHASRRANALQRKAIHIMTNSYGDEVLTDDRTDYSSSKTARQPSVGSLVGETAEVSVRTPDISDGNSMHSNICTETLQSKVTCHVTNSRRNKDFPDDHSNSMIATLTEFLDNSGDDHDDRFWQDGTAICNEATKRDESTDGWQQNSDSSNHKDIDYCEHGNELSGCDDVQDQVVQIKVEPISNDDDMPDYFSYSTSHCMDNVGWPLETSNQITSPPNDGFRSTNDGRDMATHSREIIVTLSDLQRRLALSSNRSASSRHVGSRIALSQHAKPRPASSQRVFTPHVRQSTFVPVARQSTMALARQNASADRKRERRSRPTMTLSYNYPCPHCGQRFAASTNLRGHLVKHTGVREFVCQFCSKEYGFKQKLKEHLKNVHGVIPQF